LSHGKVEEGHAITDLDHGLGANTTHGSTETTVQLQNSKLVEELDGFGVGEILVVDDLALGRRGNAVPVARLCQPTISLASSETDLHSISLGLVVKISAEESKEVVHLGLEELISPSQHTISFPP
jgi:hypothetical protein